MIPDSLPFNSFEMRAALLDVAERNNISMDARFDQLSGNDIDAPVLVLSGKCGGLLEWNKLSKLVCLCLSSAMQVV